MSVDNNTEKKPVRLLVDDSPDSQVAKEMFRLSSKFDATIIPASGYSLPAVIHNHTSFGGLRNVRYFFNLFDPIVLDLFPK